MEFRRKAKALQVAKAAARDIAEAMAQRKAWSFVFFWFGGRWFWKMVIFISWMIYDGMLKIYCVHACLLNGVII